MNKSFNTDIKLTNKQKAFVKHIIDNPKSSATEAAVQAYDVKTRRTAEVIASENLRKPEIIQALDRHSNLFESVIVGTVRDWGQSDNTRQREIAIDAAKYAHDKVHGKAKQSIDVQSTSVNIDIKLS